MVDMNLFDILVNVAISITVIIGLVLFGAGLLSVIPIKDNKHNNLYEQSDNLLIKLYRDMHCCKNDVIKINPAPHWRLLKTYGGYLTI